MPVNTGNISLTPHGNTDEFLDITGELRASPFRIPIGFRHPDGFLPLLHQRANHRGIRAGRGR